MAEGSKGCTEQERSSRRQRRCAVRRLANVDLLLEAISQFDQAPLAPRFSQNIHPHRHAEGGCSSRWRETGWHRDGGKSSDCGQNTISVGLIKFSQRHHQPLLKWIDQSVEFMLSKYRNQYLPCALVSKQPFLVVRLLQAARKSFRDQQESLQRRFVKLA